jgi:hypothetical protein
MRQRAVVHAAMIFNPCRVIGVLVKVLRADMVMLASNHPAKAGEVAFRLIGGDTHLRIRFRVVDAESFEAGVQRVPMSRFVGIESRGLRRDPGGNPDAFAFALDYERQRPSAAFAQGNNHTALAGLVLSLAAINPVLDMVALADRAANIAAVNLHMVIKLLPNDVSGHRLAQFVAKHEGGLVLAVDVPRHLQRADALRAVHEDADRRQKVNEGHLAGSEDRPAGYAELVQAFTAFELAARGDLVGVQAAATRADRSAVRLGPAHLAKGLVCPFLASLIDGFEGEGASLCGEKEVLGHLRCHRIRWCYSSYIRVYICAFNGVHHHIR